MRKKIKMLSIVSFISSIVIFLFNYVMFHYMGKDGKFSKEFKKEPEKPFVTLLFGILGTLFLFGSFISSLIAKIIFSDNKEL